MVVPPVTSGGFFFSVSPSGYRRQLCSIGIARVSRGGSRVDYRSKDWPSSVWLGPLLGLRRLASETSAARSRRRAERVGCYLSRCSVMLRVKVLPEMRTSFERPPLGYGDSNQLCFVGARTGRIALMRLLVGCLLILVALVYFQSERHDCSSMSVDNWFLCITRGVDFGAPWWRLPSLPKAPH
jgi:hypothetical protein